MVFEDSLIDYLSDSFNLSLPIVMAQVIRVDVPHWSCDCVDVVDPDLVYNDCYILQPSYIPYVETELLHEPEGKAQGIEVKVGIELNIKIGDNVLLAPLNNIHKYYVLGKR
jgi:hypothetical protein